MIFVLNHHSLHSSKAIGYCQTLTEPCTDIGGELRNDFMISPPESVLIDPKINSMKFFEKKIDILFCYPTFCVCAFVFLKP